MLKKSCLEIFKNSSKITFMVVAKKLKFTSNKASIVNSDHTTIFLSKNLIDGPLNH